MKQKRNNQPSTSMSDKSKITIILVIMGLGILLLLGLLAFLFRGSLPSFTFAGAATPFPTMVFPTPDCGSPTLVVGTTAFQIQNTSPAADGTVSVPPNVNNVAYWVEGTDQHYTFLLSPTQENISLLSSLPEGTTAKATWTNCNSVTFTLSAPQPVTLSTISRPDSSTTSMVLFVQTDASGNGLVTSGGTTEEVISTFNTPDASQGPQAEVGLLETTASSDGTMIQVKVSVYNFGTTPFALTTNDISLTPTGGTPLAMVTSKPFLPNEIAPGKTEEFIFSFPRPTTPAATLKVFTVEYDVEG
jgi:hypothetical protein